MKCPQCNRKIDDAVIARHLASKGGLSRKTKYRPSRRKAKAMARASHAARLAAKDSAEKS